MSARLARTLLLAAAFLVAASAESSSSSSTERVLSDVTKEKPPPRLRRRLKDRGVLEGEFSDDATMITADHRKPGQEEGAFTGRNPKNLKHRRLHAVEVEERKLREANYVNKEGTADFAGIVKLAKAEQDRVRGRQHQTHLTMEDLDTMYPTPEGDVRRGIAPPLEQQKNVTVEINPDRWARRSHFVEMGKPGERKSVFPEEMLNYRTTSEEMVVFVEGSLGHRYAITLQDDSSVGDLKKLVWADEREARWKIGGLQDKDKAAGFDLTEQLLFIDDIILEPDSRPLERFNVTDYKIVRVRPPSRPFTADEIDELAEHYDEMVYWRERDKAVMIEPDSDDDDSTYRMVKKMWKEVPPLLFHAQNTF
ncbi:hypothetical protein T484DRAFT_3296210 [Baffinella frigidus]|nr:hypothetical protein T484DRAFT_3296210 [Cryptophyta sp. CCMP2293]